MSKDGEVTPELEEIYASAKSEGIWLREFAPGGEGGSYMAAAGYMKVIEDLEKESGQEIDIAELQLGDLIGVSLPGVGETREEACRNAIEALKEQQGRRQGHETKRAAVGQGPGRWVTHRGELEGFFETGSEGVCWMLYTRRGRWRRLGYVLPRFFPALIEAIRDARVRRSCERIRGLAYVRMRLSFLWSPYNDLVDISDGDHLKVFNPDGSVAFDGEIVCDLDAGRRPRYCGDTYGQPCAHGMWVHWTQKGWEPDAWAGLFMRGKEKPLRAVLRKWVPKEQKKNPG